MIHPAIAAVISVLGEPELRLIADELRPHPRQQPEQTNDENEVQS